MTVRPASTVAVVVSLAALACSGFGTDPVDPAPAPVPEPEVAPAPEPEAEPQPPGDATFAPQPLGSVPMGRSAALANVTDVEVDRQGRFGLALADGALYRWDFASPPVRVAVPPDVVVLDVAPSPFTDALFAITRAGAAWRVERWEPAGDGYATGVVLHEAPVALSDLVTAYALWNDTERVWFARHAEAGPLILSTTAAGTRTYEVTTPTGRASELTDEALRNPPDSWNQPPSVLAATGAVPLGLSPGSGALLWRDAAGGLHERTYAQINWGDDAAVDAPGTTALTPSPNGWLTLGWSAERGAWVRAPGDDAPTVVEIPGGAAVRPAWVPTGRGVLAGTREGLVTAPVVHPLAAVRYLWKAHEDDLAERMARDGMVLRPTDRTQLYQIYEEGYYEQDGRPVFASIDGMLEVLHAGFEAVFVRTERELSLPRLQAVARALKAASGGSERLAGAADVTLQLSEGRAEHPDAQAAVAARGGSSAYHAGEIDWGDFKPRGPYAHDPVLQNYFRAFKYLNLLTLDEAERAALRADPAVVEALAAWNAAQAAFSTGSRQRGLLDDTWDRPAWVRPTCVEKPDDRPHRPFPLFWGVDSEILDRTTAHDRLPPECGVATRGLPTGLDLLAGLGSPYAVAWSEPDYARWPALKAVHATTARELAALDRLEGVVPGWWRIVQTLSTDDAVPEGVDAEAWRARLAETALASWTSLRHTMVLVNEVGAAEMGGGGDEGFEWLSLEPSRGVVDPVPAAWDRLAEALEALHAEAGARGSAADPLVVALGESAADARKFGDWSRRQQRGEPLSVDDYEHIAVYARSVEHPFLLFKSAAAGRGDGAVVRAEPMQRIVDIYRWDDPTGPAQYWHAAVGHPQEIVVLGPDRGLLVPGRGGVYSYREVVDGERLDDDAWRARAAAEPPLPWSATVRLGADR